MIAAQRRQHNLLRGSRRLPGILHQFGGFRSANPVARLHRFQMHVQPELSQFAGNVVDRGLRLRRSHRARADILGQMRYLVEGVVVGQSGVADRRQLLNQRRRKRGSPPLFPGDHSRILKEWLVSVRTARRGSEPEREASLGFACEPKAYLNPEAHCEGLQA